MKSKLIIASAISAVLAMPVMAQTYGSGSTSTGTSATTGASGTSATGTSATGGTMGTGAAMPKTGREAATDTRDAHGRNTMCSAKDKLKDGTCKPGAKRVSDGSMGEMPSGASGPSNASGGGGN